jgi:2,4-dichlorophenol 6-monooxygenase
MNASMNDGHNLGWKLAYVLRGWADMSLLKTVSIPYDPSAKTMNSSPGSTIRSAAALPRNWLRSTSIGRRASLRRSQPALGYLQKTSSSTSVLSRCQPSFSSLA